MLRLWESLKCSRLFFIAHSRDRTINFFRLYNRQILWPVEGSSFISCQKRKIDYSLRHCQVECFAHYKRSAIIQRLWPSWLYVCVGDLSWVQGINFPRCHARTQIVITPNDYMSEGRVALLLGLSFAAKTRKGLGISPTGARYAPYE